MSDDFWEHLREWRAIRALEERLAAVDADARLDVLRETAVALRQRLEYADLQLSALTALLDAKGLISLDELKDAMVRLDLADGVEDGRMGPDRATEAPCCPACGRPANRRRSQCVYCGAALPPVGRPGAPGSRREIKTVSCAKCGEAVAEKDGYFTDRGMVCPRCFGR
jgi:hypothetical protein